MSLRIMKKITLLFAVAIFSANVNAASSSSASLTNFQLNVISGEALLPYLDSLSVVINHNLSDQFLTSTYQFTSSFGLPISLDLTTVDGATSVSGSASGNDLLQTFTTSALSSGGFAQSDVSGSLQLQYKAFTLFSFSADATIFGSADVSNGINSADSSASISLSTASFDGNFSITNMYSSFSSAAVFSETGDYSASKKVKFFYFSDEDSIIQLGASVTAQAIAMPSVSAIPEPDTYAMMLAGLGFIGFVARRRKL